MLRPLAEGLKEHVEAGKAACPLPPSPIALAETAQVPAGPTTPSPLDWWAGRFPALGDQCCRARWAAGLGRGLGECRPCSSRWRCREDRIRPCLVGTGSCAVVPQACAAQVVVEKTAPYSKVAALSPTG